MVLAVSGPQAVGIAVIAALIFGWFAYLVVTAARPDQPPGSEIDSAPNRRRYFDDETLEGPKLDRTLSWGLATLAFIAVALPVYWLREPGRQAGAIRGFNERSAARGAELFQPVASKLPPGHIAAGCADCHGNKGQGGVANFTITVGPKGQEKVVPVQWQAPALNAVMYRFTPDQVRQILVYGRPSTPMPAWGVTGGGPLGDQQLDDLVNFLISIQLKPDEVKKASAAAGADGKTLFETFCARCHTLGWSYRDSLAEPDAKAGGGALGPNLTNGDTIRQFPDVQSQVDFILQGSIFGKNYGRRGIGTGRMPGFGPDPSAAGAIDKPHCNNGICTTYRLGETLSEEQIRAIVEYERSL